MRYHVTIGPALREGYPEIRLGCRCYSSAASVPDRTAGQLASYAGAQDVCLFQRGNF